MTLSEFTIRIMCAALAGFIIGFEREWHQKSAGIRTNTLVALGAALYVSLSFFVAGDKYDATRIIGQVVTGIGFLGGGIIFKEGINVHGLTTAATVWCSSAIGCLAAAGYYYHILIATGIIIFVNSSLRPIDEWISKKNRPPDSV
jgi:putative Mg2+ transporter-C (MgtC) family protein